MKRYLVQLNRSLLIEKDEERTKIYGFLGPYEEENDSHKDYLLSGIDAYVDYIAAMEDWCANGDDEFDVADDNEWIDKDGKEHLTCDLWAASIAKKHRKDLDYSLYLIDLDGIEGQCLECGMDKSFIICESLMDNLIRLAEQQKAEEEKEPYNIVLFNRPIWLPKHILWENEYGFCHIYGLTVDDDLDSKVLQECNLYLGYLAMVEELILNDVTPSGYTADVEKDGLYWYDRGEKYICVSEKIKKESQLCRHKHNLKLRSAVVRVPIEDLNEGTRDGLILSQKLYEQMIEIVANANDEDGCQN